MDWRHTHVWEINHQLVVADTVEEAISIYRMYSEKGILSEPITIQQIGNSDAIGKDYTAIMGYKAIPHYVGESGTVTVGSGWTLNDITQEIVPAPSSADVNWSTATNDTQSNLKAQG